MTKAQVQKSHDAMAKFLIKLCRHSDDKWNGRRKADCNKDYNLARKLIKAAGFPYKVRP